jgi:hypothetical protein
VGVWGFTESTAAGVEGNSYRGPGVYGANISSGGVGVQGVSSSGFAPGFAGVEGDNSGIGPGVFGKNTGSGIGVQGNATSSANGNPAVAGVNAGSGPGIVGYSHGIGSIGTGGVTDTGYGFFGGASGSGIGVLASSGTGTALVAAAQTAGQYAGIFQGSVSISGGLTVTDKGYKSAAVRGASGTLVRLYCMESPESWFEDFGSAQLSNGTATVQIEPGFAGVVKTDSYHVFPVANGDCKGLFVSNKTPSSFTVHEQQGGMSNVSFSYRIVAKRKDIEGARLEHVDEVPTLALPKLPEPPATPATPPAPPLPTSLGHSG